ncbi:MAG: hypothetical protein DBY32_07100 [Phascolarctobacterium sp.]|nr:MAG: hypothetical protein DBY32_07100 [Phascolarctobacterium sp.]
MNDGENNLIIQTRQPLFGGADENTAAVKTADNIIAQAVQSGASDIHLEPMENGGRVRLRTDGVLHEEAELAKTVMQGVVSRIKVLAGMDIAEKRLPQDGSIRLELDGRSVDLRISTLPTILGEKAVIRILDRERFNLKLDELNFTTANLKLYRSLYSFSSGVVLLTGPTGSGKTTTLYATLSELNNSGRNIVTIEDPVEYRIAGISQVAVNEKAGLAFASGLRSILRQDPDIMMIGEIRDIDTAQTAIHAALTGHLVFSTLHTNSAAGAVVRLVDMGIEPFLVASALRGVVAQRLVRRICPHCKTAYAASAEEKAYLKTDSSLTLYNGSGCEKCRGTGYLGRMALQEVMPILPELKKFILKETHEDALFDEARKYGAVSMREDGITKVLQGMTTVSELMRAVH